MNSVKLRNHLAQNSMNYCVRSIKCFPISIPGSIRNTCLAIVTSDIFQLSTKIYHLLQKLYFLDMSVNSSKEGHDVASINFALQDDWLFRDGSLWETMANNIFRSFACSLSTQRFVLFSLC